MKLSKQNVLICCLLSITTSMWGMEKQTDHQNIAHHASSNENLASNILRKRKSNATSTRTVTEKQKQAQPKNNCCKSVCLPLCMISAYLCCSYWTYSKAPQVMSFKPLA
jgi:hypothetical protein